MKPLIGLTMGDPAGIGPELILRVSSNLTRNKHARFVLFGDFSYLRKSYRYFKTKKRIRGPFRFFRIETMDGLKRETLSHSRKIPVLDIPIANESQIKFSVARRNFGQAAGDFIAQSVQAALLKKIHALVTLPINKKSFHLGNWGKRFTDHTTMVGVLANTPETMLMLVSGPVRAVHATLHIPLRKVADQLTKEKVGRAIRLAHQAVRNMGISQPKIVVCGLNPHAGDDGVIGGEEKTIILPVIKKLRRQNFKVEGPLSADVVWPKVRDGKFDVGVAMYHDQGQIAVKLSGKNVVNVTLGLPFVRTSVGHGTAFDIAGKGIADPESLIAAIDFAIRSVRSK